MSVSAVQETPLLGGPNGTSSSSGRNLMHIQLSDDLLELLLDSTRNGKPPRIQFGSNPLLVLNNDTILLSPKSCNHPQEIYKESSKGLDYLGSISHSITVQKSNGNNEDMEIALEQLRQSNQKHDLESKKTEIISKNGKSKLNTHSRNLSSTSNIPSKSSTSSNNDQLLKDVETCMRYALIHLLASGERSVQSAAKYLRVDMNQIQTIIEKVGEKNLDGKYSLSKKIYREVEPWEFPYSKESLRSNVIDNAIHAFDAMRIDANDEIWQKLLPENERGQGKILSRLKIQPKISTPILKPTSYDKKTGLPKSKKPEKTQGQENKKTEVTKVSPTKAEIKKAKESKQSPTPRSSIEKPSTATKALLNKPRNPSPLAASPVNASELDASHPVHRTLSASPTKGNTNSVSSLKRKATTDTNNRPTKHSKATEISISSNNLKTTLKRKSDAASLRDDEQPRKVSKESGGTSVKSVSKNIGSTMKRSVNSSNNTPQYKHTTPTSTTVTTTVAANGYARGNSLESASSPEEDNMVLSARQRVKLAAEFKRYYARYHKLYRELENKPNTLKTEELWVMHTKLAKMKDQLKNGTMH